MQNRLATTGAAIVALGAYVAMALGLARIAESAEFDPPSYSTRGNLVLDGVPPPPPALAARVAAYFAGRTAQFVDWLPDGSMLILTRFGEQDELHRLRAPLGAREQLTFNSLPVTTASAPTVGSAAGLVFLAPGDGGAAAAQIYYYSLADRSVRLLSDGKSVYADLHWSRDGRQLAYSQRATDRSGTTDVYAMDPTGGVAPRVIVAGADASWRPLDWSLDGHQLLLWKGVRSNGGSAGGGSAGEGELVLADVASGTLTPLGPEGGPASAVAAGEAKFAPDGRGVYFLSDAGISNAGSEFRQLFYLDLVSHQARLVTDALPWDVTSFDASADGRYLAYVANVDGASQLTVIDTLQRTDLALAPLPAGTIGRIAFDGGGHRLALTLDAAVAPADVYVYNLEHGTLERWTQSEVGAVDPATFVEPTLERYPSFDRVAGKPREIPAYVYRPSRSPATTEAARHPVLIDLHDGPDAQYRRSFDPFIQYLVHDLGFLVVCPNVRGSSGYGKSYRGLDDGTLRDDAARDVGALIIWLGLQPDVDRTQIIVAGAGYGGYLALEALAAYGDRLRGGIDVAGMSDLVSFLELSPPDRLQDRRSEFGDERDSRMRSYLQRVSPLNRVAALQKPLLVVHGMSDRQVPVRESEQLVGALRGRRGEVWYLGSKPDTGFESRDDQVFRLVTEAEFLEHLLRGEDAPGSR